MALYVPQPQPLVPEINLLKNLVIKFNAIPETNHIQRLFHLQKINYLINNIPMNELLFNWLNISGSMGWQDHLQAYGINPDASFFLKGVQFASAVDNHMEFGKSIKVRIGDEMEYTLMQERDKLLKKNTTDESIDDYITISANLDSLAATDKLLKERVKKQTEILDAAKIKFDAIKGRAIVKDVTTPSYKTTILSEKNNKNFSFAMGHLEEPFIFRVEDKKKVGFDQELHSFPVSKYFIEDYGIFMNSFKEDNKEIEYKPVVLSQFANEGNLAEVAFNLSSHKDNHTKIASTCALYFGQLSDFCTKLMAANAYHPDIKLSNFLVHNSLIRVSDRKTLITDKKPKAKDLRSTPTYAPIEWAECLNEEEDDFNYLKATKAQMDMPQFMAYQLGIALKEFLRLSQGVQTTKETSWQLKRAEWPASSYFNSPKNQIINLSLLVEELTRKDPGKRLRIEHIQKLLMLRNASPDQFFDEVENLLPSATIGIGNEFKEINELLKGKLRDKELITKANVIFLKLAQNPSRDHRLTLMAEKLAIKCFNEYTESFFAETIQEEIHIPTLDKDWDAAPWYRKALHWISGGYFRVDRLTDTHDAEPDLINIFKMPENQFYFPHLKFLPKSKLEKLGEKEQFDRFSLIIESTLNDIVPEYAITPTEEEAPKPAVVVSGTVPLTDIDPNQSPPVSSMVVTDKPNPVVPGGFQGSFFNQDTPPVTPSNNQPAPPPSPARPISSIKDALLQGDGSRGRIRLPALKVSVKDINWQNPETGENTAPQDGAEPATARP